MVKISPIIIIIFFISSMISCQGEQPTEQVEIITKKDTILKKEIVAAIEKDTIATLVDTIAIDSTPLPQKVEKPTRKPAKMKFEHLIFKYDTIEQGDVITHDFKFKNIGERPLVVNNVFGSCGCTIASYPFLDIAPNESNTIKSKFDSKGKKGFQKTTITVQCNGKPKTYKLTLEGYVKVKE